MPDKKWIACFQQEDGNSKDWKNVLKANKNISRNDVERRTRERAPEIRAIPPAHTECLGQTAKKIDQAKMELQDTTEKMQQMSVLRSVSPPTPL